MTIKEKYDLWLNEAQMPQNLKEELEVMDECEIEEAFIKDLEFGTGGLRGIMGAGTNRLNIFTIRKTTQGFANYLLKDPKNKEKGVAISYDNRHNSKEFAKETAMVLAANGIKVYLYKELRPTPMVSYAVRYYGCAGGVMITASHNPKEYNGYKVYNETGAQLSLKESEEAIQEINNITNYFDIKTVDNDLIVPILEEVEEAYLKDVASIKINDTPKDVTILYSPLHGTGKTVIPKFMQAQGYNLLEYNKHSFIDPDFPNAKVSNPEMIEAWEGTGEVGLKYNADIIVFTDPDADRVGISVKHGNNYILLNGNQGAAITVYYLLSQKKAKGLLKPGGYVFSTIVTSDLILEIGRSFEQNAVATLTGFKFIGEKAREIDGKAEYQFGCEESIGSIISDFVRDKDAVQQVYMYAEIADWLKAQDRTMIDYLHEIYEKYGYYLEHTENIVLKGLEGAEQIKKIMNHVREHKIELHDHEVIKYDDVLVGKTYHKDGKEEKVDLPPSNVLKFYFDNNMWIIFRPSGTEPKLKVYFSVVGKSQEEAEHKLNSVLGETLSYVNDILHE